MKDRTLLLSLLFAGLIHAGLLMVGVPAIEPATVAMPQAVQVSLIPGPSPAAEPAGPPPATKQEAPKPSVHQAKKSPPQKKIEKISPEKPKPVPVPKPVPPPKPEPIPPPEPEPETKPVEEIIQDVQPEPQPAEPEQLSEDIEETQGASASSDAEPASKAESFFAADTAGSDSTERASASGGLNSKGIGGEGVEKMPSYSYNPKPRYPRQARNAGREGTVMLRVEVLFSGRVGRIRVDKSTGYTILDAAAVEAVKRWRFTPAKRGSRSVTTWVLVPIEFNLRD
jgi:protein TonB